MPTSRWSGTALAGLLVAASLLAAESRSVAPDPRYALGAVLASDDFTGDLTQWRVESEQGGRVTARNGGLEIDVPAGCTVWFARPFDGPVLIEYEATAIDHGGTNDRVSDLNCFWMARDARNPGELFAVTRSGRFSEYDRLCCYYVGLGGNGNTTTRFRRYVGESGNRPLRAVDDLKAPDVLLAANAKQTLQLLAAGNRIEFFRDGRRLFGFDDPTPYTSGWFGLRTVRSHLRIERFRVYRLVPRPAPRVSDR